MNARWSRLDPKGWFAAWEQVEPGLPGPAAYWHPAWSELSAAWEGARAACWACSPKAGLLALAPMLEHGLPSWSGLPGRWDAQTAYGYGGPAFLGPWQEAERVEALKALGPTLAAEGCVAELLRCPAGAPPDPALAGAGYRLIRVRQNVHCALPQGEGSPWQEQWHEAARRNVRKALRQGLSLSQAQGPQAALDFLGLYRPAAQRLGMAAHYHFDEAYVLALAGLGPDLVRFVEVRQQDGALAASGILLLGRPMAVYHLGASRPELQQLRPSDLLYEGMAQAAQGCACSAINWGGGTGDDPEDSLFHYKRRFGQGLEPAFIAGRILDPAAFDQARQARQLRAPGSQSRLFLAYRG